MCAWEERRPGLFPGTASPYGGAPVEEGEHMQVEFFADTKVLRQRFEDLVSKAETIEVAVAWAGKPDTGVQGLLWRMKKKIRKLVVGCTLYNTNPDFLKRWQGQPGFR